MPRRPHYTTWLIALVALGIASAGCGELKRLRDLRDQATFGASGMEGGPTSVPVDDGPPPLPQRDAGTVGDVVAGEDAGVDGIFIPVEDAETGPTFDEPPLLLAVYPPAGPANDTTLVTVEGARFTWDMEVRLGGELVTQFDYISEYEFFFAAEPRAPGTYDLKVTTDGGVALYEGAFTYLESLSVTGIEPAVGPTDGGLPATVHGTGFDVRTRFVVGEREAQDVRILGPRTAEIIVPPADTRGAVDVLATGSGFARLADAFEYRERPRLDALLPRVGSTRGGETLRIDGRGIREGCLLVFGAGTATVERTASGWLFVESPGGSPGAADVAVDCGESGFSYHLDAFTFVSADTTPELMLVSPNIGFTRGGDLVTLSGAALDGVSSVRFGSEDAGIIEQSSFGVTVLAPAGAAGAVDVVAHTADEELRLVDAFIYVDAPAFDSASPDTGALDGGWTSTLLGLGLDSVDELRVDERALEITAADSGTITFTTNAGAAGRADLMASVAGLDVDTGVDLHFTDGRQFDGFSPMSGVATGGTAVYITGSGFDESCIVSFDDEPAATAFLNTFVLVATTPPHEPGWSSVSVAGCGDEWIAPRQFQYFDPALPPGGVGGGDIVGEVNVAVIEAGTNAPIEGATVQVQVRDTTPYVALTDARGMVTFVGDDLIGEQTVTAFAPGRSAETYVNLNARRVTLVLQPLPPPPCDPEVEDCTSPPPPVGTVIGFLTGLRKIGDPPPGATVGATIETTRYSHNFGNPSPGPDSVLYANGGFTITTRLGEFALIAQCGWFLEDGSFVPRRIGVERGIFIREGDPAYRTAIDCNIPLRESLSFKITGAPAIIEPDVEAGITYPAFFEIAASYDMGADGVFETLPPIRTTDPLSTGGALPAFEGPFATATLDLEATALDLTARFPYVMSFVRGIESYDRVVSFPSMMPLPTITTPSEEDPYLVDGYVEWDYDLSAPPPDLFYFSVSATGEDFPRWGIFVPGHQRELNLAEFPEFTEGIGRVPAPGEPGTVINFYIRAIDRAVFDFDDFDRYALRSSGWNSVAVAYQSVMLSGSR